MKIYVYGFPSLYGGAGTELHHQILAWLHMKLEVHIIPTNKGYKNETLYPEMVTLGVTIHEADEFDAIERDAPVIGFCNCEFLNALDRIYAKSQNTIFINCMTWLFDQEKQRMQEGLIRTFLYQNDEVRKKNQPILRGLNADPRIRSLTFSPYFDATKFPFIEKRHNEYFGCGRISRQDSDKFSANTLHIYEYFVSPKMKKGLFLGFDQRSEKKIGKPFSWIQTVIDHKKVSQQDFYKHCEIVLQPMDTTENWPRVGFEAMSSGSVLVVDNRGGWRQQVEHGVTGFLCNTQQEFIYHASRLAFEPELRAEMARKARSRAEMLGGLDASAESWRAVFQ